MLYNFDENEDLFHLLAVIEGFCETFEISYLDVSLSAAKSALLGMRRDFPHIDGMEAASPFKKLANFFCYFVAQSPISHTLYGDPEGSRIRKHNVIIALHVVCDAMHGAVIKRTPKDVILTNRIELSRHSYLDLIEALQNVTPANHFHIVACLFEQLAYRVNPHASYEMKPLVV